MSAIPLPIEQSTQAAPPIVVIGSGPVGVRVVQELLQRRPTASVVLYGAEAVEPYNRVRLSSYLAGDVSWEDLRNDMQLPPCQGLQRRYGCAVVSVDRHQRVVTDATGRVQPYSQLVFATGSRPYLPAIDGISLPGVFTFRDFLDTQQLLTRRASRPSIVVVGGGLLGIETANAMLRHNARVLLVDHHSRLMSRQLDKRASARLLEHLLSIGIHVELGRGVRHIFGEQEVEGVMLINGTRIECDTVVVATGIRPAIDLARNAGIAVDRGIRVDDQMRTDDEHIFAVGECAQHRGVIYGVLAPGLEQAAVAAASICGQASSYRGSTPATRLKVVGLPVFSIGVTSPEDMPAGARAHVQESGNRYSRLVTRRGRLIGALQIGEERETGRLQEAVVRRRPIFPWQLLRFSRTGMLWREEERSRHQPDRPDALRLLR